MHELVLTFDALAVILLALTVNKIALGIALILSYSLDIGTVLVAVEAQFVRAQSALLDHSRFERVSRWSPALAAVVLVQGAVLIVRTVIA